MVMAWFMWRRNQWTISSIIEDVVLVICVLGLAFKVEYGRAVFILPEERTTGLGCIPDGTTVNYECTTVDTSSNPVLGSTVWLGSAFNCPTNNDISLSHGLYGSVVSGTCGNLSAMSIGVDGTNYTSRLTVTANTGLNGTMINCTISNVLLEGSDTIRIGVIPPAPGPINITFSNSGPPSFTVSWSPPSSPVVGGIGGYMFGVTGDCGDCMDMTVSADTLSVTCSGWTANGQTCTFEVRTLTQDCGFTSQDGASKNVTLSVPSPPTIVSIEPRYHVNGSMQYMDLEFTGVMAPMLGINLPSDMSYTVSFAGRSTPLQFTMVTCNTTNYCTLRVLGSELSPSDTYTVSVVASNIVGSGIAAVFPSTVVTNTISGNIVRMVVNVSSATVSCNLLSSYTDTSNAVCTISYGPTPNCSMYTDSSIPMTGSSGDTLTISLSQPLDPSTVYCYTVTLPNGGIILAIEGKLRTTCDPEELGSVGVSSSSNGPGMVTVMNGVVNYDGVTTDSTAQLVCSNGYIPGEDSGDRMCLSDGNWSVGTQTCVVNQLSCGKFCIIGIAVGAVVLLLLGCLVIIMIAVKCHHKGSGSFKTKQQNSKITVEQHDYVPGTFALQSEPSEPPPPLYADPEDLIQSHNIDRRAVDNRSKRQERRSEEEASPYEQPLKRGATITKEGQDHEKQIDTSDSENPPEHTNPEYNVYQSIEKPKPTTSVPPPSSQALYSEVFDALPRGKTTKVVNKSTLPRGV